jgi:capsular polysaccharide biosynthesis protein
MIDPSWHVEEPDPGEPVDVTATQGGPVSAHYLLAALRRRRAVVVLCALLGGILGAVYAAVVPAQRDATVQLLLNHDPALGSASAIATDVSLLRTGKVAESVIQDLGLDMTPDAFQQKVTVLTPTDQIMVLTVSGSSAADALARAGTLADDFLTFRNTQVVAQSKALADLYSQKLEDVNNQAVPLRQKYNALLAAGDAAQANTFLPTLNSLETEAQALQQNADDVSLRGDSVVGSSHVVDPASLVPRSALKQLLLAIASGVLLGTAVAVGVVLFVAVTSDRLWRRDEVATALGVPVRYSVGRVRSRRFALRGRRARRERNLAVLVRGLAQPLHGSEQRRPRLAVVPVGCTDDAELAVVGLARSARAAGLKPFLVDLTYEGSLTEAVARDARKARDEDAEVPAVFRPPGVPTLAQGPAGVWLEAGAEVPADHPLRPAWDSRGIVVTLAEVDPAVGAEHLPPWSDQAVVMVRAGRASAERLRTTAELVRQSGVPIRAAELVRADRGDESLGTPLGGVDRGSGGPGTGRR